MTRMRHLAVVAVLALALVACGGDGGADAETDGGSASTNTASGGAEAEDLGDAAPLEELTTLRVGYLPSLSLASPFLADEFGYMADENLEIEWISIANIADALLLLAQGDLDLYLGSPAAPMYNQLASGLDVKMIASIASIDVEEPHEAASGLYVRKELLDSGEVESVADLEGRRVGMVGTVGSATSFLVHRVLAEGGLTFDDVDLESLGLPETLTGLDTGAIDAGFITAPYTFEAEEQGIALPIVDAREAYGDARTSALLVGPNLLFDGRSAAVAFLRASMRGAQDLQGDYREDPEVVAALASFMDVDESVVEGGAIYLFFSDLSPDPSTAMEMQELFLGIPDILGYDEPLTVDDIVDPSFQELALASLD